MIKSASWTVDRISSLVHKSHGARRGVKDSQSRLLPKQVYQSSSSRSHLITTRSFSISRSTSQSPKHSSSLPISPSDPTSSTTESSTSSNVISSGSESLPRFNILFCGSDDFSVACLDAIYKIPDIWNSIHVVTPSEKRLTTRRKTTKYIPALLDYAIRNNLPRSDIPQEGGIKSWSPPPSFSHTPPLDSNLLITASFGHIIPNSILSLFFPNRSLNVHPSVLPRYRGAAPVQWAIANGDENTGVTVQTLVPREQGIDSGEILGSVEGISIPPTATYHQLLPQLAEIGGRLLVNVLRDIQTGKSRGRSQDSSLVTRAPKIRHDTARIRWTDQTSTRIDQLSRGISHQFPLWTTFASHPVQLVSLTPANASTLPRYVNKPHLQHPGTASLDKSTSPRLLVACADVDGDQQGEGSKGSKWLEVSRIKMGDGGKIMGVADWWNGLPKDLRKQGFIRFD